MPRKMPPASALALLVALVCITAAPESLAGKGKSSGAGTCRGKTCDTRPPSVAIAEPTAGDAISGTAVVTGSATDSGEILVVQISVDGDTSVDAAGSAAWSAALDTTAHANGSHLITVTATDLAGNVGAASVAVDFSNQTTPPPPLPTEPPPPPPPEAPSPGPSNGTPVAAPALASGAIGGYVFQETDRDGVYESDERPLADRHLFLFDGAGNYLKNTYSNAAGWYQFEGLANGEYRVDFAPADWWAIREDWVPDTTGTLLPSRSVELAGSARVDLGWREIVRSSDPNAPLSSYIGASGVEVLSYDDVVPAREIHDRLLSGTLVGDEARFVTIRFDYTRVGSTSTVAAESNGVYTDYHATSNLSYVSWLDGDGELFHEYGHAWSLYHAYVSHGDPSLSAYLEARGLLTDPRVNSSYSWNARELVAEDYRQLFGTPSARAVSQLNRELPPPSAVPGLRDFLATTFTTSSTRPSTP